MTFERNCAAVRSIRVSRGGRFASMKRLRTFVYLEALRMILAASFWTVSIFTSYVMLVEMRVTEA